MKRSITRWTATLATAALLGLPAVGAAQTPQPPTQQPPTTPPPATQPPTTQPPQTPPPAEPSPAQQPPATTATPQTQSNPAVSPQEHLGQAKTALDAIQTSAVTGQARTQLAELKRHVSVLEKASAPASGTKAPSNAWGTEVAAMDKILTDLLGTDATAAKGATAGTTGATGTSGTTRSKAAPTVSLDEVTRAKLMDVRTHITAYAVAMSGASATPKSEDAMPAGAPAASASTPQAGSPAAPAGSTSPGATPPAAAPQTAGAQPPAETAPQPAATAEQPQVDPEAARRHLTAARDTLGQLTKLPAAAQLTGEARTQVGQLIANFNDLITTQSQWRASYAKVAANLTALLGPDAEAQQAAAVPPTTPEATPPAGATPPTAAPGAVGTSGTSTDDLDPSLREKLVELRRNLKEFEKASGGAEQK